MFWTIARAEHFVHAVEQRHSAHHWKYPAAGRHRFGADKRNRRARDKSGDGRAVAPHVVVGEMDGKISQLLPGTYGIAPLDTTHLNEPT